MENASKALIMAASVLLGVMIISVGVALFNSFGGFSSEIADQIEKTKIAEFNSQFFKYYGETMEFNEQTNKYEKQKIKITIHDVITLANLANKNNIEYEVQDQNGKSENSNYIQIEFNKYSNLEKAREEVLTQLIKDNDLTTNNSGEPQTKYYYITNIETSKKTGKVIYVQIQEI